MLHRTGTSHERGAGVGPTVCTVLLLALAAAAVPRAAPSGQDVVKPSEAQGPAEATAPPQDAIGRKPTGKIRGTVLDPGKKPMAGILVQLASRDEAGVLRITGTDDKGQYIFKDLPAGTYRLEVAAPTGEQASKAKIEVRPPFQNIVDFEIVAGARAPRPAAEGAGAPPAEATRAPVTVRGLFLDQSKRPIPEVSVTLIAIEGSDTYHASSDEDGAVSFAAVPPGRYRALIESPGHVSLDLKAVDVPPVSGLDLSMVLVDHPLNFRGKDGVLLPPEKPRPAPRPGSVS